MALYVSLTSPCTAQLGWQIGEEGSVIMPEPLFTPRVGSTTCRKGIQTCKLLTSSLPQADREQLTQLAFEEFNMTGFFLCDQPVLSLYAVGKITGTVVDLGHCKTGTVTDRYLVSQPKQRQACQEGIMNTLLCKSQLTPFLTQLHQSVFQVRSVLCNIIKQRLLCLLTYCLILRSA